MILLTGATSQVGEVIINKLKNGNEKVRCFVRKTSKIEKLKGNNIEFSYGDFNDIDSIKEALNGVDYLIHIGGIWHAENFLSILDKEGNKIRKAVFVGSTSRFQKIGSEDEKELKLVERMTKAEEIINQSKQNTVILRPTMLYGIDKDKNILNLIKIMDKFRVFPVIGKGTGMKQPVHVEDVADAVISVMYNENVNKKSYNLPGRNPIGYNDMLKEIRKNLNKPIIIVHIPISLAKFAFKIYKKVNPNTIVNIAMVNRVNKSFTFDFEEARKDFGYSPMSFEEGVKKQIDYLKNIGGIT